MKRSIKTDLISYCIIFFCVGVFIGFVLTTIYVKNAFEKEIIVKVQPMGYKQYPYYPYHQYFTTLPEELHKVKIKNGNVINIKRIGFAYQED